MMRVTTLISTVLFATLTLSATNTLAKEEIYRWVDKDGVVHFGSRPEGHDAEVVDIGTAPVSDSQGNPEPSSVYDKNPEPTHAQKLREERAQSRKEATEKQKELDSLCGKHREMVAKLEPSTRVIIQNEDGDVVRMDDNDRLEYLNESKAFIAENCNN